MNAENFCYWLQGLLELQRPESLDARQLQEIKNHLAVVLKIEQSPASFFNSTTAIGTPQTYCQALELEEFKITDCRNTFITC